MVAIATTVVAIVIIITAQITIIIASKRTIIISHDIPIKEKARKLLFDSKGFSRESTWFMRPNISHLVYKMNPTHTNKVTILT